MASNAPTIVKAGPTGAAVKPAVANPTPKQRFISLGRIQQHRDMIASEQFQSSCDYALMEYQAQLALRPMPSFNEAAASHIRLQGALEFIQQLRLLGEVPSNPPIVVERDNLDHRT